MSKHYSPKVLAVVPARSGSKGLPGKYLRPLCGRPLINWSIDTALACEEIDVVVVSTDDQQTAAVAAAAGAEVPFFRPPNLASDSASSIDVVLHALNFLERKVRFLISSYCWNLLRHCVRLRIFRKHFGA